MIYPPRVLHGINLSVGALSLVYIYHLPKRYFQENLSFLFFSFPFLSLHPSLFYRVGMLSLLPHGVTEDARCGVRV